MDLILVRHARAFDRDPAAWPDDSRRPLTAGGRDEFTPLAKRLGRIVPEVELVESSRFVRAWQTAQLLSEHSGWPRPSHLERLEPGSDEGPSAAGESSDARIDSLVRALEGMRGIRAVAWVGHEPMLSRLASRLLTGSGDGMSVDFKKGAALSLRLEDGRRARFQWMITPRLVARMRRGK